MEDIEGHTNLILQTLKGQLTVKIRYIMAKYRDNPVARISLVQQANIEYYQAINSIRAIYFGSNLPINININDNDKAILRRSIKKALLFGINYRNTEYELAGCINDAYSIEKLLKTKYGYASTSVITDDSFIRPTCNNMYNQIKNFINSGIRGDTLFLFYSGHGNYVKDKNKDEQTGNDQVLVGCDFVYLVDDIMKNLLNTSLKPGVTLIMVTDSCFSGSVLDLRYQYMDTLKNKSVNTNVRQLETRGNVILISACQDNQTAVDTSFNSIPNGALTGALLKVLENGTKPTWSNLITQLRTFTKQLNFTQTAQLSSGKPLNINIPICI